METMVVIDGSDGRKFDDSEVENSAYSTYPHEQIADPVVYKLVRVEGDGRLVPATDDEIMEVVDLLKDEKSDTDIVDTCEENVASSTSESFGRKIVLGYSESVKAEEEKIDQRLQEAAPCSDNSSGSKDNNLSGLTGESSNPPGSSKDEVPAIAVCTSLKPDFSKLKGEICLDNLSIRDLHETFRATFGRETTVKDKAWLKRRISMGLTNSCDISTTSFSIKDGKAMKLSKEGTSTCIPYPITSPRNQVRDEHSKGSAIQSTSQVKDCQVVLGKGLRNHDPVDGFESDAQHQEDATTAKRIRKPTKRYIEELSELETTEHNGRVLNSSRGAEQLSPKFVTGSARHVSSGGKITRLDSLSGIRVPCVSRIRRSRPRKDIMSLSKFYQKVGETANFGKPFGKRSYQSAAESDEDHARAIFTQKQVQLLEDPDEQFFIMDEIELEHKDCTIKDLGSSEDIPNDNIALVPTSKGGVRRKHHRAWTLSEVIKLVEGVSKYGVGRWSEIKRLSFASYSYRTSVDLKDKWRNLLKAASFSSSPTDLMNSRKHAVTPIPGPVLSRIRELAEINGQPLSPNLSSLKVASDSPSGPTTRTGFL